MCAMNSGSSSSGVIVWVELGCEGRPVPIRSGWLGLPVPMGLVRLSRGSVSESRSRFILPLS